MTRPTRFHPEDLLAHADWARDLARRLVRDDATADDLVQETFAATLGHPPREEGPLRPWLGRVLANAARMRARGEGRRARRERRTARDEALPSAAELTERTEAQRLLMDALLELDEARREVVLLRYFEGLSSAAIARRQGVPAGTVRWRLKQGLDELRARLDERFGGERERWHHALGALVLPSVAPRAAGAVAVLTGALSMKITLYAVAGIAAVLLVGFALVATGVLDSPFAEPPLEDVRFEPLARPALAVPEPESEFTAAPGVESRSSVAEEREEPPAATDATIRMRFVDGERRPVAEVSVEVRPSRSREPWRSGADGVVELGFQPFGPDGLARLAFACPGFASDALEVRASAGEVIDLGELELHAGGALSGRVVDEGGVPLADVEVRVPGREVSVSAAGGMRMSRASDLGAARATTDDEGRFRLAGLLAGEVRVEAESSDELYRGTSGRVAVRAGQESTGLVVVAARVPERLRVEGIVLDPGGAPLPWAPVSARYRSMWSSGTLSGVSGEDGRFRLVLHKSVDVDLEVRDPERRWSGVTAEDVAPGTLDLVLRFAAAEPLDLALVDPSGAPVARASVAVWSADGERHLAWAPDVAQPDGSARLLRPGEPFRLEVLAEGHARAELGPLDPAALGAAPLRVELVPLPGITGRVVSDGSGAAGARLFVHALSRERTLADGVPVWVEPAPSSEGSADADGHFELTLREPERYVLRAELEGHTPAEHGPFDYDPALGLAGVTLELREGGTIEGRVVRADGLQRSSIVLVSRGDAHPLTQRTTPDGRFRFEHLMPGPWQVLRLEAEPGMGRSSSSDGGPPYRAIEPDCRVFAGETTRYDLLEGAAHVAATVHGRLRIEGGAAAGWTAELVPLEESARVAEGVSRGLDADGGFELESARPGRYRLLLSSDPDGEGLRLLTELDLAAGEQSWEASVALGTLVLTGLATGEDEPPVAVLWRGERGLWALALARGDGAGRARLTVPAGAVEVARPGPNAAADPREWPVVGEAVVAAGGETTLGL